MALPFYKHNRQGSHSAHFRLFKLPLFLRSITEKQHIFQLISI